MTDSLIAAIENEVAGHLASSPVTVVGASGVFGLGALSAHPLGNGVAIRA